MAENDKQQSAMVPFAPIELPHPARLSEEASAVPDEQTDLDPKQGFLRYLNSCVAHRVGEMKRHYARGLAETLAATSRTAEQAQDSQSVIGVNEETIAELERDMENLQEDIERYRIATKKNDRSSARVKASHQQMLKELARGYCGTARVIITVAPSWGIKAMDPFVRTIERELDSILSLKKSACSNPLDNAQVIGGRRKA